MNFCHRYHLHMLKNEKHLDICLPQKHHRLFIFDASHSTCTCTIFIHLDLCFSARASARAHAHYTHTLISFYMISFRV